MAYVYGGITLSPKPPAQFAIGVRVNVGVQSIPTTGPELGDDYALWHYLAVIKPGQTKVVCTVGDIVVMKNVEAKSEQASIVNFCFGRHVVSFNARDLPKMKVRRKEREKVPEGGPTGEGGSNAVS